MLEILINFVFALVLASPMLLKYWFGIFIEFKVKKAIKQRLNEISCKNCHWRTVSDWCVDCKFVKKGVKNERNS